MKKNKPLSIGALIIASAIIWGAMIVGSALILKGTPYKESINRLLIGGVITHLILIWGPMGLLFKKSKKEEGETEEK